MTTRKAVPSGRFGLLVSKNRTILFVGLGVVVVLGLLFVGRGWLRAIVIPKAVGAAKLGSVQATLDKESAVLQDPLTRLGFTSVHTHKQCNLQQAQGIHTEVDCSVARQGYTKLPAASVASVQEQAAALRAQLLANSWHEGSNGVSLTSLINGTSRGIDYSPDAYYEKVVGNADCVFDVMIAYANPQPAAIQSTFSCDQTTNFLGAPKNEIYDSSKGHL